MSSTKATVTRHTSKLPTFYCGEITALACSEFQDACSNYFALKDTAAEKQVSIMLGCFEDMKVSNWTRPIAARKHRVALTFPEFMGEFRKKFLCTDWKEATRAELLSSRMKTTETFDEWTNLESLAALLADDPSVPSSFSLNQKRLRHMIEASMLPDLAHCYARDENASKIAEDKLDDWLTAVIKIDEQRQYNNEHIEIMLAGKECGTADERKLLRTNDGCNKCSKFFMGHQTKTCTNGFPDPANYQTLTQADVNRAKTASKGKSVTVVMPGVDDSDDSADDNELASVSADSVPITLHTFDGNASSKGR
ncbi:hypothetical protein FB451DRAFT_1403620 [Mycena latifolia]|nr:hypothetical protein FB451DRAFT_1403620 [Mycena latifolia]